MSVLKHPSRLPLYDRDTPHPNLLSVSEWRSLERYIKVDAKPRAYEWYESDWIPREILFTELYLYDDTVSICPKPFIPPNYVDKN